MLAKLRCVQFEAIVRPASLGQTITFGVVSSLDITQKWTQFDLAFAPALPRNSEDPPWLIETDIGYESPLSVAKRRNDKPTCFKLFTQEILWALALALARAGRSSPARMAMMAITTNSSMSVKAPALSSLNTRFI